MPIRKESGITVHVVDERIDTGAVVMLQKIPIDDRGCFWPADCRNWASWVLR
ncbi:MAG: hypothetical protein IPI88_10860 [Chitinophagaceae bacterium]|nr:hypothetical protein [Chitinophagaceae bacterium]